MQYGYKPGFVLAYKASACHLSVLRIAAPV